MQGLASHAPHQVRALMNTNTSGLKDFSFVQAMGSPFAPGKLTQDHFTRRHQPETVYQDLPKWARISSGNSATDFKLFEPKSVSKPASASQTANPSDSLIASDAATPGISIFMALSATLVRIYQRMLNQQSKQSKLAAEQSAEKTSETSGLPKSGIIA